MPYVKDELRTVVDTELSRLIEKFGCTKPEEVVGLLNYCMTEMVVKVLKAKYGGQWRYAGINDMIGVLECCKLELYRRGAASYEDSCVTRNGDVRAYE